MDTDLLQSLYGLISTDGRTDEQKFSEFVNEEARISFYGDFLYPLARSATLEQYYREAAEGTINERLLGCRAKIWEALSPFSMKLICLSPAEFIHFGTTTELRRLVTADVEDYEFLDWKSRFPPQRRKPRPMPPTTAMWENAPASPAALIWKTATCWMKVW